MRTGVSIRGEKNCQKKEKKRKKEYKINKKLKKQITQIEEGGASAMFFFVALYRQMKSYKSINDRTRGIFSVINGDNRIHRTNK